MLNNDINRILRKGVKEGYSRNLFINLIDLIATDLNYRYKIKHYALRDWRNFNYQEAEKIIKNLPTKSKYERYWRFELFNTIPSGIKRMQENISKMKNKSQKFPNKKLKLESILLEAKKSHYKVLMQNKVPLTKEERDEAMARDAVWHPSNHDKPVCAIWKSKRPDGSFVYGCNTHRAMQVKSTLKGAINAFKFIKTTA